METRRVERCYKGTLCLRYAGSVWVCPEADSGFKLGERPYVSLCHDTVIVRRVGGRLRETWKRLRRTQELSMTEIIEQIVRHASRVDGKGYSPEDVEVVLKATALPGPARAFAGWARQARIGPHKTEPQLAADEQRALSSLLGILGSMPSAKTLAERIGATPLKPGQNPRRH